ncbi:outer membrane beta-barrel protein [Catalinimonas niigatensis]|uniref:outer membrane beta-barrel protein n=1 Tax=Catalinimonas niigatensis TaxID=1397264 RepID=UPI002666E4F2|nr:outer membrane beta-barrel protein [Catalinimonas niigatensis]WPP50125.1 outer membrane beta-barrel protein [Catalinimonas niigatensis]
MKKLILFSFFFSFAIFSWAQGIHWGLNIAPGISYRIGHDQQMTDHARSIQSGEKPMHVFDFGIDLRKNITNRLSIGTGIFYSQKGFSNTHAAAVYNDPTLSRRYILDFVQDYLEIPFFLTYNVYQNDQIQLYPMLGVNNSLLLNEKNSVSYTGGEVSEETMEKLSTPYLSRSKLHNIGVMGGIGIMGAVDPKTAIGLEAVGKVMLTPLSDNFSNTDRYLYSFNLNFKFIRKIR